MTTLSLSSLHTPTVSDKLECLVTNGTGSFASLAIHGGLSRKFHGLLVHSVVPPMDRMMTWHHCAETLNGVSLDSRQWLTEEQTTHRAGGEKHLLSFQARPMPTWVYQVHGCQLKKELFMVPGRACTLLRYTLLAAPDETANLTLLNSVHFRAAEGHKARLTADDVSQWHYSPEHRSLSNDTVQLRFGLQSTEAKRNITEQWLPLDTAQQQHHLVYPLEREDQGYDQFDASLPVYQADVTLGVNQSVTLIGTLEDTWPNAEQAYQRALTEGRTRISDNDFFNDLTTSALQLVADRQSVQGKTLLAGFPWFGDWGRDTMIALAGTTLSTGQPDLARNILKTFAHYLNGGMLPNKFPDRAGEPLRYNTIDATLWFFRAIQQYADHTGDWAFIRDVLYDDLKDIIRHHQRGTRYGIHMDSDGLISGGDADTQLTWMDVKFDGYAVTPRYGKAVEINALWYNALNFLADCAEHFQEESQPYRELAQRVEQSFQNTFWNAQAGCCYDYVANGQPNDDIRCNQIIAVALPYSPLTTSQQADVFHCVYDKLYTPVGLRSLAADHPDYKGRYYGALSDRDLAYHQGTVWAWPMGCFIDAAMKVTGDKSLAEHLLRGMKQHFYTEAGLNGISEVFDGDAPHAARGCFQQAWSVAETLRVVAGYDLNVPD
ncbi:amylo-alpha-1,6-glucosidase [Reinekea blandensis]|uniref:Glycogen debranching enzyme n=1 Tax=Reinekea blandensis MED297 TaxID=314283 RepID=A4BBV2_9GAMM|nr:amylo-alpha-1,6-glucosidase [Reinekea blandensis]EAR10437.1 Glycogen debranching enzyme [Reinekea sp. MED297] [Reinekea blandensis MED297]